jgi:hypothetical protein
LDPIVEAYRICKVDGEKGVLLLAGFSETASKPMDLGATDVKCRCITLLSCDSFESFQKILRRRKGFTRSNEKNEGFAYFTQGVTKAEIDRFYLGSLFEYNIQNDNKSWFDWLEFAKTRTNEKIGAAGKRFNMI